MLKGPYSSLIIGSRASKHANKLKEIMALPFFINDQDITIGKQIPISDLLSVNLGSENICGLCILLTTDVVPNIFPNLNEVAHSVEPACLGSCLPRLAIFIPLGRPPLNSVSQSLL